MQRFVAVAQTICALSTLYEQTRHHVRIDQLVAHRLMTIFGSFILRPIKASPLWSLGAALSFHRRPRWLPPSHT